MTEDGDAPGGDKAANSTLSLHSEGQEEGSRVSARHGVHSTSPVSNLRR
jgi:hypothetical protein